MLILRGPLAHTHFRIERLLAKINQIVPQIIGLNTEFVHFLEGTGLNGAVSISNKENKILLDLLNYGPTAESLQLLEYRYNLILITPRVGGVSEWSMKATEIFHHCGNTLRLPHSKALGQGLFELKEKQYGYRIYYTFLKGQRVIMLHAGDKSTQKKDIKIARERLLAMQQYSKQPQEYPM